MQVVQHTYIHIHTQTGRPLFGKVYTCLQIVIRKGFGQIGQFFQGKYMIALKIFCNIVIELILAKIIIKYFKETVKFSFKNLILNSEL